MAGVKVQRVNCLKLGKIVKDKIEGISFKLHGKSQRNSLNKSKEQRILDHARNISVG